MNAIEVRDEHKGEDTTQRLWVGCEPFGRQSPVGCQAGKLIPLEIERRSALLGTLRAECERVERGIGSYCDQTVEMGRNEGFKERTTIAAQMNISSLGGQHAMGRH